MGSGAKSYMWKGFPIYEEMRKFFTIYDFAPDPSEFPLCEENIFFFISETSPILRDMAMRQIFWGFCINRFSIGPIQYISSRSDFGFEFAEIFVIENRLPDSLRRGVDKNAYRYKFFQAFK